jgi:hypothetical protein
VVVIVDLFLGVLAGDMLVMAVVQVAMVEHGRMFLFKVIPVAAAALEDILVQGEKAEDTHQVAIGRDCREMVVAAAAAAEALQSRLVAAAVAVLEF